MKDQIAPLVISSPGKDILDVVMMNSKGYRKSLENGTLWILHKDTSRLLPWKEDSIMESLRDQGHWYSAVVSVLQKDTDSGISSGSNEQMPDMAALLDNSPAVNHLPSDTMGMEQASEILIRLAGIIHERKTTLPEGSYTTHLFTSGPDKIRKKTGEEAVELILARDEKEIIYESADLIYHLFVLLEAENIPFQLILKELQGRF